MDQREQSGCLPLRFGSLPFGKLRGALASMALCPPHTGAAVGTCSGAKALVDQNGQECYSDKIDHQNDLFTEREQNKVRTKGAHKITLVAA